ncbi:MAG: PspA/IM30 family protein [Thermostichales cyanobacterium BF4_bins_65]
MGLFERVGRIIKANLNALVSAAEDPEKILNQTIEDMQEDLIQMRQSVAQAMASQKRMEKQYEQARQNVEEWQKRAELALRNNNEQLAREALMRKKTFAETAASMKKQLDEQNAQLLILRDNMAKLESKIAEAKTKKDMLIARARSAKATEQINQVIGKVNTSSAVAAFDRMEAKVEQLEARSAAVAELATDSLERQFLALEGGSSGVDDELALLKAKVLGSGSTPSGSLPSGSSAVDEELEDLKRSIDQI